MAEKILVVDDEREIADLVTLYLKNEGYETLVCYNGQEALEQIQAGPVDLAILDVMLPEISGFELCRRIRARYQYPVIMLTAKGEELDKPLILSSSSPLAVSMITGYWYLSRMRLHSSKPLISGSITSKMAKSTGPAWICSRASCPL